MVAQAKDDIARVAYAIWQAEGQPRGRDAEHWARAERLLEEGRAEAEFTAPRPDDDRAPRSVQPGFADAAPGMTPVMKSKAGGEPPEEPGGRFAKQLSGPPDEQTDAAPEPPGPRNPEPEPPTNAEGYVAIPSVDDRTPGAISDDPAPPEPPARPRPPAARGAGRGDRAGRRGRE